MNIVKKLFGRGKGSSKSQVEKQPLTNTDVVAIALGKREAGNHHNNQHAISTAISTLGYDSELLSLVQTPNKYSKLAIENLTAKIDNNQVSLDQLKQDMPKLSDQLRIVSYCKNDAPLKALLDPIENESTLVSLCQETQSANLRQQLVAKIHSQSQLKRLEAEYKNKDKRSYQLIKTKLDAFKLEEQAKIEQQKTRDQYLNELELQSKRTFHKDYTAQFERLERKYDKIFNASTEDDQLAVNAQQLLATCRNTVEEAAVHQANDSTSIREAEQAPTQQALTEQALKSRVTDAESVVSEDATNKIIDIASSCLSEAFIQPEYRAVLSNELDQIETPIEETPQQSTRDYINLVEAAKAFLYALNHDDQTLTALKCAYHTDTSQQTDTVLANTAENDQEQPELKPTELAPEPSFDKGALKIIERYTRPFEKNRLFSSKYASTQLAARLNKKRQALAESEAKDKTIFRQVSSLMRKAQGAVTDGHLKRAQGIRHSIEEQLSHATYMPSHIERQWETLQKSVDDLGDWQSYAIAPKLDSLVDEMKALAETPKQAELQATKIKQLQDQWKSITKGSGKKHQALWEQFKSHSDTAYEVCKKHYDELDEVRAENTLKRDTLIQQLSEYLAAYDWQTANWQQVEKVIISAKKEWRTYSPTLRNKQKAQQAEFNAALEPIQNKLDEEYAANKTEKERLINSLKPLTEADDLHHAIDVAIKFQKQWKTIGRCRRKDDDALWQTFRTLCDTIFAKRDKERNQSRAQIDEKIKQAEAVLTKVEHLVALDTESFEQSYRDLDEFKLAFEAIEDLPKSVDVALGKKFQKLQNSAESRLHDLQKEKKNKTRQQAFLLKALLVNKQSSETTESEINQLPSSLSKALQKSISAVECDSGSTQQLYRELCIRAEVMSDAETPAEDKNLRMQLQVQQLQSGFGQQSATVADLTQQWLSAPNVSFELYDSLQARFLSNCKAT